GDPVHRGGGARGVAPLARSFVSMRCNALDSDARRALPLHSEHCGVDDRRARPPSLDCLCPATRGSTEVSQREPWVGGVLDLGVHGALSRARHPLSLSGGKRDRPWSAGCPESRRRIGGSMEAAWFAVIGFMLAVYVVLDGFDFGAGILHLVIAKTDEER